MFLLTSTLLFAGLMTSFGCDGQVDQDYEGEPLATMLGTIRNEMTSAPPSAIVAVFWVNSAGSPDFFVGETVPVEAHFPADFSMKLYTSPPAEVLNDFTMGGRFPHETRIGMAWIAVGAPDAQGELNPDLAGPGSCLGLAEDHVLAYVEEDIVPGTFSELFVQGPLKAGYHVLQVERQSDAEVQRAMDCLAKATTTQDEIACGLASGDLYSDAPQGLNTRIPVRLVDDCDTLEPANLK